MNNQEAIEVLRNIRGYLESANVEAEVLIHEELYGAANTAISALEAQQRDGWIPITERNPESEGQYDITIIIGKKPFKEEAFWRNDKFVKYNDDLPWTPRNITAWRTQEPYRGR